MKSISLAFASVCLLLAASPVLAVPSGFPKQAIVSAVNEAKLTVLAGNTRPEANADNDQGAVEGSMPMQHMLLQLKRTPEREAALTQLIDDLHNPQSESFHQWLTPQEFATHYGVAGEDVATVTRWLQSQGLTVNGVTPSGMLVDFSGTAAQVTQAFRTEIHRYLVDGVSHIANASDPKMPTALAPVVAGVVSLHDFRPKAQLVPRPKPGYTYTTTNGTFHALVAGDIATIYNLKPLFDAGYTGKGQTIMVVEDTYLYTTARSEYGKNGSAACNSTTVAKTGNSCIFYDVTQGDNVGACKKFHGTAYDCFLEKGDKYGISSTSDRSSDPAYITNVGWDFPSGIGSVNAFNLVMEWPGG